MHDYAIKHILKYSRDLLFLSEITAAAVGIFYIQKFRNSRPGILFILLLVFVALAEIIGYNLVLDKKYKLNTALYNYLFTPIQFILPMLIFYYGLRLKAIRTVILICLALYLVGWFITNFTDFDKWAGIDKKLFNSLSYDLGVFCFSVIISLFFYYFNKSESILSYKTQLLFYLASGLMIAYLGTWPYMAFRIYLHEEYRMVFNYYQIFSHLLNSIMYTIFSISLIWAKPNSHCF